MIGYIANYSYELFIIEKNKGINILPLYFHTYGIQTSYIEYG